MAANIDLFGPVLRRAHGDLPPERYMARQLKAKQRLIDFSRESFGDHLSELLLCGYGEQRILSSRDFAIKLADRKETETQLRLMFVAEGPASTQPSLPRGKEPLVLLALLQLLMSKGGESIYRLTYTCDDLMKLLGWENTAQSKSRVDVSVTKYFHTFYQLSDDSPGKVTGSGSERTRKVRALAGQDFAGEESGLGNSMIRAVSFGIDFIEPLKKRNLLGIDWNLVQSVTALPVEFFNL